MSLCREAQQQQQMFAHEAGHASSVSHRVMEGWLIVGMVWLGLATDGFDIKARQFACLGAWFESECKLTMQIGNRPEFKSH